MFSILQKSKPQKSVGMFAIFHCRTDDYERILIKLDTISHISPVEDGCDLYCDTEDEGWFEVSESFDEVISILKECNLLGSRGF